MIPCPMKVWPGYSGEGIEMTERRIRTTIHITLIKFNEDVSIKILEAINNILNISTIIFFLFVIWQCSIALEP